MKTTVLELSGKAVNRQENHHCRYLNIYDFPLIYTGWDKGRFPVVSMRNAEFILLFLFIVLFSIQRIANLPLPHPVLVIEGNLKF